MLHNVTSMHSAGGGGKHIAINRAYQYIWGEV